MADFPTYAALLEKTSILAASNLDVSTAANTAAVPIGSGTFPYEAYATGVDFYFTTVNGTNAIGNLTGNVQCSFDGSTWFTDAASSFVMAVPNAQAVRWSVRVDSRQWRFVRMSFLCQNAQATTISTVQVDAQLRGLQKPFTINFPS